jgi:hypothetical protein
MFNQFFINREIVNMVFIVAPKDNPKHSAISLAKLPTTIEASSTCGSERLTADNAKGNRFRLQSLPHRNQITSLCSSSTQPGALIIATDPGQAST